MGTWVLVATSWVWRGEGEWWLGVVLNRHHQLQGFGRGVGDVGD